jgi:hypothetical protein
MDVSGCELQTALAILNHFLASQEHKENAET